MYERNKVTRMGVRLVWGGEERSWWHRSSGSDKLRLWEHFG